MIKKSFLSLVRNIDVLFYKYNITLIALLMNRLTFIKFIKVRHTVLYGLYSRLYLQLLIISVHTLGPRTLTWTPEKKQTPDIGYLEQSVFK